jgi:hypothetical protein
MRSLHAAAAFLLLGFATGAVADPTTTISGKAFVDYSYRDNKDNGTNLSDKGSGASLDLKRFYLGVDHKFDSVWAARFRTDVGNEVNGKYDVFVKHAFVQATLDPALVIRAGAADLPWVPMVEDLYGYRYVENVLVDRSKFDTSADWGIHALGKFGGGLVNYAVSVFNGRGYGDPTRTKAPAVEARIGLVPVEGLTLAVGGTATKLGQNVEGTSTPNTATRYDALIAWVSGPLRAGATGFYATDYDKGMVLGTTPSDKAMGFSGWASFAFTPMVAVFGRADYIQPRKDTNSGLKDTYMNAGLEFTPVKPLNLSLVYKYETTENGTVSTSNGTIGSTVAGSKGTYNEVGLWAQYSF